MKKILTVLTLTLCFTTVFAQRGRSSSGSSFSRPSSSGSFGSRTSTFSSPRQSPSRPSTFSGNFGRSSSGSVMGSGRSSTSTFNSNGSMTGSTQKTFGGGVSTPRVAPVSSRKVAVPAKVTTTYSPERKFKVGTKPTVKYSSTTVVNNRTVYVYPGGGYSYTPMGSIIGYYDAPRYVSAPVVIPVPVNTYSQPVYSDPTPNNAGNIILGGVLIIVIVGAVCFFASR